MEVNGNETQPCEQPIVVNQAAAGTTIEVLKYDQIIKNRDPRFAEFEKKYLALYRTPKRVTAFRLLSRFAQTVFAANYRENGSSPKEALLKTLEYFNGFKKDELAAFMPPSLPCEGSKIWFEDRGTNGGGNRFTTGLKKQILQFNVWGSPEPTVIVSSRGRNGHETEVFDLKRIKNSLQDEYDGKSGLKKWWMRLNEKAPFKLGMLEGTASVGILSTGGILAGIPKAVSAAIGLVVPVLRSASERRALDKSGWRETHDEQISIMAAEIASKGSEDGEEIRQATLEAAHELESVSILGSMRRKNLGRVAGVLAAGAGVAAFVLSKIMPIGVLPSSDANGENAGSERGAVMQNLSAAQVAALQGENPLAQAQTGLPQPVAEPLSATPMPDASPVASVGPEPPVPAEPAAAPPPPPTLKPLTQQAQDILAKINKFEPNKTRILAGFDANQRQAVKSFLRAGHAKTLWEAVFQATGDRALVKWFLMERLPLENVKAKAAPLNLENENDFLKARETLVRASGFAHLLYRVYSLGDLENLDVPDQLKEQLQKELYFIGIHGAAAADLLEDAGF